MWVSTVPEHRNTSVFNVLFTMLKIFVLYSECLKCVPNNTTSDPSNSTGKLRNYSHFRQWAWGWRHNLPNFKQLVKGWCLIWIENYLALNPATYTLPCYSGSFVWTVYLKGSSCPGWCCSVSWASPHSRRGHWLYSPSSGTCLGCCLITGRRCARGSH